MQLAVSVAVVLLTAASASSPPASEAAPAQAAAKAGKQRSSGAAAPAARPGGHEPAAATGHPDPQASAANDPAATGAEGAPEWFTEPRDPDPFGFGIYKGQRPDYMDTALVNGAKMAISHILTKDPPVVVLEWYRAELQKLGHGLIEGAPPQAPGMRYLSFRPPGSRKLKTVTLLPHGRGTMILVSVGDPSPLFKPPGQGLDLPMPPGAGPMVTSSLGEAGPNQRHASFEVRGLAPSSVRRFYEDELPRRGFQRGDWMEGQQEAPLVFTRGREQLTLTATTASTPDSSRVSVLWIRENP